MKTRRVLVVDDNSDIHRDFQKLLAPRPPTTTLDQLNDELFGPKASVRPVSEFEVLCASNGVDAMRLLERECAAGRRFDLAFVDMRMPGWDGLETITNLWTLQHDLKVIVCTAYMDYSWQDVLQRLNRPGLRLLRKPWSSSDLMAIVHELTGRSPPTQRSR
jgi:CheY-like chemotaxis protein